MKRFKDFFKSRKVLAKKKTVVDNNFRDKVNYINQPPYGAEGRTLTPQDQSLNAVT